MKLNNNDEESPIGHTIKSWAELSRKLHQYIDNKPDIDIKYIQRIAKIATNFFENSNFFCSSFSGSNLENCIFILSCL